MHKKEDLGERKGGDLDAKGATRGTREEDAGEGCGDGEGGANLNA